MRADSFIDTNVFVYQVDSRDPRKQAIAEALVREALMTGGACISWQVAQEWLNTVTRKAEIGLDPARAGRFLDVVLLPLMAVLPNAEIYHRCLVLQQRWQLGFDDALIVAAALSAGCSRLLSSASWRA